MSTQQTFMPDDDEVCPHHSPTKQTKRRKATKPWHVLSVWFIDGKWWTVGKFKTEQEANRFMEKHKRRYHSPPPCKVVNVEKQNETN